MEERELIKSKHYNALILAIIIIVIGLLVSLIWHMSVYSHSKEVCAEEIRWYERYQYNGRDKFFDMYGSEFAYIKMHMYNDGTGCHVTPVWSFIPLGACVLIAAILYFGMKSYSLTVTDKRIYGKTWFGKRVDLPVDSVSAISTIAIFRGIAVATSSGKISFLLIKNSKDVYASLNSLIISRQEKKVESKSTEIIRETQPLSNADELKKYKDLLDAGVITQEEFDAKKKQLLGL